MEDFKISLTRGIDLNRALVLVSFPTIGNVSSIAANYMVKKLKMERVGAITSKKFIPSAVVEDYVPSPQVRIYVGHCKCGPDATCETFLVILSEVPPPEDVVHDLAEAILSWLKEKRAQYLVTMVGIKIPEEEEVQPEVYGIASKKSTREMLRKRGPKLLENAIIGGISGAFLARGSEMNMITLITQAHEKHSEAGAAARLLETVSKVLVPLNISLEPLYEEAEEIEADINANLKGVPPGMYR